MSVNEAMLATIEIELAAPVNKSVIWMHGLGADGADFTPLVTELRLPSTMNVRFIFPHAPKIPVTINNGYTMRAWFDIYARSIDSKIDENGIAASVAEIQKLIAHEIERGVEARNIILAGFSQGSVIALTTGLTYHNPIGGIIALSGYLPLAEKVLQHASASTRKIPIFIGHGVEDTVVSYALGKATYAALHQAGCDVMWRSYNMGHTVCGQEVNDISTWIQNIYKE